MRQSCLVRYIYTRTILNLIVPGVAFDRKGNRLGRGKGYYDRLLSRMAHTDVYKLGICFPYQLVESVPTDAHDIAMDEIL